MKTKPPAAQGLGSPLAIGIDLGASHVAIAAATAAQAPRLLHWHQSQDLASPQLTIPTAIFFPQESPGVWCGEPAYQALLSAPERGAHFFKRRMKETDWDLAIDDKLYDAQALSTALLAYARELTSEHIPLGQEITCVTVPANFEDLARRRTMQAAQDAGWHQVVLLNEPTAAALAYAASRQTEEPIQVMVFDLGGATLDVSILTLGAGQVEVHACLGDMELGGQDWDECLAWDAAHRFASEFHWSLFDDPIAFETLRRACQRAKERLTLHENTAFSFTYDGCHLAMSWTQADLESISEGLLQRCVDTAHKALEEAKISPDALGLIILAGGGGRMSILRRRLASAFTCPIDESLDPGAAVALGATHYAAGQQALPPGLVGHDPDHRKLLPGHRLAEASSHPLGFLLQQGEEVHNRVVLPRHTPLPVSKTLQGFTTSHDNQAHIDIFLTQTDIPNPPETAIFDVWRIAQLPKKPAGELQLSLTFSYHESGLIGLAGEIVAAPSQTPSPKALSVERLPLASSVAALLQPKPRDIVLAIDCSASMQGRAILEAKLAARQFIQALDPGTTRLGLLSFGDPNVTLRVRLDQDPMLMRPHIAALQAKGKTPLSQAIEKGCEALTVPRFDGTEPEQILLIMTDGHPDQPALASKAAASARENNIRIVTIGIGDAFNEDYLRHQVCSTPEDFKSVEDPILLGEVMAALAAELAVAGGELVKFQSEGE